MGEGLSRPDQVGLPVHRANHPSILVITLVMLGWGVASDALREIITGFLNEVRFD
jgi:hypothetical protein